MNQLEQLQHIIDQSKRIVFFTGAGVSTESGIPDFRSQDGLYHLKYDYNPETILSHSFFMKMPQEFYRFYHDKMLYPEAKPNEAHKFMAKAEKAGKSLGVITQNIDNLHQMAGCTRVVELHGSVVRNTCMNCHHQFGIEVILKEEIPTCEFCGGMIKPDVVLYGEPLDNRCLDKAIEMIREADTLIIAGTSCSVYPAAGLVQHFRGNHLVIINKSTTQYDQKATCCIAYPVAEVLSKIKI